MLCTQTCMEQCDVLAPLVAEGLTHDEVSAVIEDAREAASLYYATCGNGGPVDVPARRLSEAWRRCDLPHDVTVGVSAVALARARGHLAAPELANELSEV